jgi:predicted methyltransferase
MGGDYTAKFFTDAYAALKPGGVLGVVEHRLPSSAEQNPRAATGYVHEDFVKALAASAGFEFVEASEINANPNDTADHPFGVWTLPPVSRTSDREGNTPERFDPAVYAAIGESDRMTLKFKKPDAEVLEPVE